MTGDQPQDVWTGWPDRPRIGPFQSTCPHCGHATTWEKAGEFNKPQIKIPELGNFQIWATVEGISCAGCGGLVIGAFVAEFARGRALSLGDPAIPDVAPAIIYPRRTRRVRVPATAEASVRSSYLEACEVVHQSPAAAAALARRCLQCILHQRMKIRAKDLFKEIEVACTRDELTKPVRDRLHHVREIGNFAAHPKADKSRGEPVEGDPAVTIAEVTADEAEYTIRVVEMIFADLYDRAAETSAMEALIAAKKGRPG